MFTSQQEADYSIILFSFFVLLLITIILIAAILYHNRRKKYLQETALLRSQFSQTLLQSQIEIKEQTLQYISRELHDNLGQIASLIKINLNTLQLHDSIKANEKIEDTKDLTRQLIADIKSLSVSMGNDRILQTGLANAIKAEVDRLNRTGEFTATFTISGTMNVIDNDKSVILFRMAQEVLNNMVKHSRATQLTINLSFTEKLFTLALSDNGIGFNVEEKLRSLGAGLRNLTARAILINATLHIKSLSGNGTTITIELPL